MIYTKNDDSPFQVHISFHKVVERLEEIASFDIDYRANYAKGLLDEVKKMPELISGITDFSKLEEHRLLIRNLLADLFPTALSANEIKAAAIPFHNILFNYSNRFNTILENAGSNFNMNIREFDDQQIYVMSCCLILLKYYNYKIDVVKSLFYDIPDQNGIILHYRVLYNVDFVEVIPTEKAHRLSMEEIEELMDNFDNFDLWREKFPPKSWILKGFGIMNLYDATIESAISNLKTNLLGKKENQDYISKNIQTIFRSIFKVADLETGYTAVNAEENRFIKAPFDDSLKSFILQETETRHPSDLICDNLFDCVIKKHQYFSVSNLDKFLKENPNNNLLKHFSSLGIKSFLLIPLMSNTKLLGVMELVSYQKHQLNSMNAHKMDVVMPYLQETMERFYNDIELEIEAVIQKEYTAIHPSVYWKFKEEVASHITDKNKRDLPYKEIVFENVWPLYGQIDVKDSSKYRNQAILDDLETQINLLISLFEKIALTNSTETLAANVFELQNFKNNLNNTLQADSEVLIHTFILNESHPLLEQFRNSGAEVNQWILDYFEKLNPQTQLVYDSRKDYDYTLSVINKRLAAVMDTEQEKVQTLFPHYYERFKTDGVEHNLYIGASINPKITYKSIYLQQLRLWQLFVMCKMENKYFFLRKELPYSLDVTSLILVFNAPISIRFRMDEKHFDVDGTYNARYEVVKKRIDKANIKGTTERITKCGHIVIVYSQKEEAVDYKNYIHFLQNQGFLNQEVEEFDVEDLQGVTGLKALRVGLNYNKGTSGLTYNRLLELYV